MEIAELVLKFIETLIWPLIAVIVIIIFRDKLSNFLDRLKTIQLPGGISLESFEAKLETAKIISKEFNLASHSKIKFSGNRSIRKRIVSKRTTPYDSEKSSNVVDLKFYRKLAESDKKLATSGLRANLEFMIRKLAKVFNVQVKEGKSIDDVVSLLLHKEIINPIQADFMRLLIQITNYGFYGGEVSDRQFDTIMDLFKTFSENYFDLLNIGASEE